MLITEAGRFGFLVDNDLLGGGAGAILGVITRLSTEAADGDGIGGTIDGERREVGRLEGGGVGAMLELLDERSRLRAGESGLESSSSTLGDKRPVSMRFLLFDAM